MAENPISPDKEDSKSAQTNSSGLENDSGNDDALSSSGSTSATSSSSPATLNSEVQSTLSDNSKLPSSPSPDSSDRLVASDSSTGTSSVAVNSTEQTDLSVKPDASGRSSDHSTEEDPSNSGDSDNSDKDKVLVSPGNKTSEEEQKSNNPETTLTDEEVRAHVMDELAEQDIKQDFQNIVKSVATSTDPIDFDLYSGVSHEDFQIPKWAVKFNIWRRKVMSEFLFLLWLAAIVGAVAGFLAYLFNRMISNLSDIFIRQIHEHELNWWLIPVPMIGILLTGIFTRYVVKINLTHGVSQLMADIYRGKFKLRSSLIFSPIFGSTITLGFGGSAGSEGPIAYAGAAVGSNIGRILGLTDDRLKFLIGCGAAAGISGIFMSPMGGMLFTLEFLRMELLSLSILAVVVACLVAYGIVYFCNGSIPMSTFMPEQVLEPHYYWAVIALGLFCGFYSLYYSAAINRSDQYFRQLKNPWIRNITGGLFVGICLFLFPSLYGVGYPVLSDTIHCNYEELMGGNILEHLHLGKWSMIIVAACILILKCWATGTTNASGGVSSDFAPTLFAGGIAGFLFATFSNEVFSTHLPVGFFSFLGMAGVMAGAIEAPLMTIFIVLNMGLSFNYALPLSICAYISYVTVRLCSQLRGYDSKMVRHLFWFGHKNNTGS